MTVACARTTRRMVRAATLRRAGSTTMRRLLGQRFLAGFSLQLCNPRRLLVLLSLAHLQGKPKFASFRLRRSQQRGSGRSIVCRSGCAGSSGSGCARARRDDSCRCGGIRWCDDGSGRRRRIGRCLFAGGRWMTAAFARLGHHFCRMRRRMQEG